MSTPHVPSALAATGDAAVVPTTGGAADAGAGVADPQLERLTGLAATLVVRP
jgi:hypothetical protein